MLRLSILFFIIALIAAAFGFGGIADSAVEVGKVLFFVFLALFALALVVGGLRGRPGETV